MTTYFNRTLVRYIYDFYYGGFVDKTQIEMEVFNKLLTLDADNLDSLKQTKQTLKFLKQINPSEYEIRKGRITINHEILRKKIKIY